MEGIAEDTLPIRCMGNEKVESDEKREEKDTKTVPFVKPNGLDPKPIRGSSDAEEVEAKQFRYL